MTIREPSRPTPLRHWSDATAVATVVPDGAMPGELNAVAVHPFSAVSAMPAGWEALTVDGPAFTEPAWRPLPGLQHAAGVAIEEPDGRVWLVSPTNAHGGYRSTLPKGRVEDGLSLRATAVKEVLEEAGLYVELTGFLLDVRVRRR